MTVKTVYIAHPVGGDVENNAKEILRICRAVHTKETIPVAPYLVSIQYLDDSVHEDRELGIDANIEAFRRGFIDEVWLYGPKISAGMIKEIDLAISYNIPVIAKDTRLKHALELILNPKI